MHAYINEHIWRAPYPLVRDLPPNTLFSVGGIPYMKTDGGVVLLDRDFRAQTPSLELTTYILTKTPGVIYGTLHIKPVG